MSAPAPGPGAPAAVHAILGTAGHIDHGKSALVRALTGIEPDRLPEERERGISIELGFAHLDLEGVGRVGVVDVPGHERFLRQMLAGAHGFDLVLVVVAADDGVMPQTEEHFDIVHLLGVRRATFVVTKSDAVAPSRIDEVREEIEILAAGTRFEEAPVLVVSARTGDGIEALKATIATSLADLPARREDAPLRIPVDRVFVSKGHGVIVTGTALAGRVAVGDEVALLPEPVDAAGRLARSGRRNARVREIQVHGSPVDSAGAGQRVALNLSGVDRGDVARGDTIAAAGGPVRSTLRLDARVEVRPAAGKPLASHVRVRVHHGTRETLARLVWLDCRAEVEPRASAYAQLALAEPLVVSAGDRFVLRDETASRTLGGGIVLLAEAPRHRRSRGDVAPVLEALEHGDDATRLATQLALAETPALEAADAAAAIGIALPALARLVRDDPRLVALGDDASPMVAARARVDDWTVRLRAAVEEFQRANPNLPGVDLEHLRGSMSPVLDAKVFRLVVARMTGDGSLVRRGNVVHTRDHAASLAGAEEALAKRIVARIETAGVMPPTAKELAAELGVDGSRIVRVAEVLVLRGDLVKIAADLYFAPAAVASIRERLEERLRIDGEITAAAFRDLISASRKYVIPLLDWFDRSGVTLRVGDVRRLRKS